MSNEISQYFCHPGGQSLWNGPIYWWPMKCNDCCGEFASNQIVFWIESISNRNRIESKGFCNILIENRIKLKPIWFDSPVAHAPRLWGWLLHKATNLKREMDSGGNGFLPGLLLLYDPEKQFLLNLCVPFLNMISRKSCPFILYNLINMKIREVRVNKKQKKVRNMTKASANTQNK
jgi:hypothetical protein